MGFENWLHKVIANFIKDDKEYLIFITGMIGIAIFFYGTIS
jgi:hypothetical protein